jgi:excisionase family DNA binding protein
MSAVWVDDEPIPYALTDAGRREAANTLTADVAARVACVSRDVVWRAARTGALEGVRAGREWLFARADVEAWAAGRRLPAAPLLNAIDGAGGGAACGVRPGSAEQKALERARADGTLTIRAADRLAVRLLGITPWEMWPEVG